MKDSHRHHRFGTFDERLAHFCALQEIDPPEIVYEDGEPTMTEDLANWSCKHNVEMNWLFLGNPSIALSEWSKQQGEFATFAEFIEPMAPEVRSAFLAMLRAVANNGIPMEEAMAVFDQVAQEHGEAA